MKLNSWKRHCSDCNGLHLETKACPGTLPIKDQERIVWRGQAEGEKQDTLLAFGILFAETNVGWRARIMTFPRTLWLLPGSNSTLKFFAREPEHAVGLALEYLRLHCRGRRLSLSNVEFLEDFIPERLGSFKIPPPRKATQEHRKPAFLEVLFGRRRLNHNGTTRDLSPHGIFIFTEVTLESETVVQLELHHADQKFPLSGSVRWVREEPMPGIGVELFDPPEGYQKLVSSLPESF